MMKKHGLNLLLLCLITTMPLFAENEIFEKKTLVARDGGTLPYRLLTPQDRNAAEKYPLFIFLHGSGEKGDNNESQLMYIDKYLVNKEGRAAFPMVAILPQCPTDSYWPFNAHPDKEGRWDRINYPLKEKISPILRRVEELIKETVKTQKIDKKRIYVVGLSMGAMGTLDIVARNPSMFAAAVPICGGVNVDRFKSSVKGTAFRVYHGEKDPVVPVENAYELVNALKKLGVEVTYIGYPGVEHASWNNAFAEPDFFTWILAQRRK